MHVRVRRHILFSAPPARVWEVLTDMSLMPMFEGWGPIPGIASAEWIEGSPGKAGAIRTVKNRDGTQHKEQLMVVKPHQRIEDRIYDIESPLGAIVDDVRDEFLLEPIGEKTKLHRTFTFQLRSVFWWPVAMVIRVMMGAAVSRHHKLLAKKLA